MKNLVKFAVGAIAVCAAVALAVSRRVDVDIIPINPSLVDMASADTDERLMMARSEFVTFGDELLLARPRQLKLYGRDLFVADGYYMRVDRIDTDGNRLKSYGMGAGRGPGELTRLLDYDVYGDSLWLLDDISRRVLRFSSDGTFQSQFPLERPVSRIVALDTTLVLMDLMQPAPFRWLSRGGTIVDSLAIFALGEVQNPLSLSGSLMKDKRGHTTYLPLYAGYLFILDKPIPRAIELVDKVPFPEARTTERNGRDLFFAPNQKIKMRSVSFADDKAWILVLFLDENGEHVRATLDAYEYPQGTYVGSFEMPPGVNSAVVYDSTIFAVKDTTLLKAEILP